jgi:hypothetical protein
MDSNDCTIFLNYSITLYNNGLKDKARELFLKSESIFNELDEEDKETEMLDQRQLLIDALGLQDGA